MPMTKVELLKRYPLPWSVDAYEDSIWFVAANGECVDWTYGPVAEYIVTCVNAIDQYPNPAAVGEVLELLRKYVAAPPNAQPEWWALLDALAALDQAPEKEEEI